MQFTIQLKDGKQYPFAVAEGQASTDFLLGVKYWEIFDRPILRIHDRKDTWAFNPDTIEKIHFLTSEDPGWQPSENILAVKCVTLESYQRKAAVLAARLQHSAPTFEEGKVFEAILKITLASGTVDLFECILMLKQGREQQFNLYRLFQKVAYTIPCESGGFVLLNPMNIACIHMHPSPPEDSNSAWLVDEFTGKESEYRPLATGSGNI